jgi:hypothetical protein
LLTLPRQSSSGNGQNSAQIIDDLAADIVSKLPADFNLDFVNNFKLIYFLVHIFDYQDKINLRL